MPNTFAPNGFQQYTGTGSLPTYEQVVASISASNTTNIFFGDPVIQAAGTTGVGTGYITQGYGPVGVTVGATAISVTAAGVMTVTFSAPVATSGNLPTSPNTWAPPIGTTMLISGSTATSANLNGVYSITSSTTTTAVTSFNGNTTGSVLASTASGTVTFIVPIAGVFAGCKYTSTSQKRTVWSNYWPGSDATGDVTAYITTDPNAQFIVQTANSNTTATAVGLANVGENISFAYLDSANAGTETNGKTSTGLSTMFADQFSLIANSASGAQSNAFLPFRIVSLANYTPGAVSPLATIDGNDSTSAYNRIVVGFNNSMPRGFVGI
jgi:hypothetical protein